MSVCVCVLELYCVWKYGDKISVCVYLNCTVCGNIEIRCLCLCLWVSSVVHVSVQAQNNSLYSGTLVCSVTYAHAVPRRPLCTLKFNLSNCHMKSTAQPAPIFTILANAEQRCVHIVITEFQQNWTVNVESTNSNLLTPVSKVRVELR